MEVELEIRTIPGVVDAAVVGIPDPKAGEVPLAFVVKKPDSSVTETTVKQQNYLLWVFEQHTLFSFYSSNQ